MKSHSAYPRKLLQDIIKRLGPNFSGEEFKTSQSRSIHAPSNCICKNEIMADRERRQTHQNCTRRLAELHTKDSVPVDKMRSCHRQRYLTWATLTGRYAPCFG